jgi:hypothetical protein
VAATDQQTQQSVGSIIPRCRPRLPDFAGSVPRPPSAKIGASVEFCPSGLAAERARFVQRFGRAYGYGGRLDAMRPTELSRLTGSVYVDHAGASLYSEAQLVDVLQAWQRPELSVSRGFAFEGLGFEGLGFEGLGFEGRLGARCRQPPGCRSPGRR